MLHVYSARRLQFTAVNNKHCPLNSADIRAMLSDGIIFEVIWSFHLLLYNRIKLQDFANVEKALDGVD